MTHLFRAGALAAAVALLALPALAPPASAHIPTPTPTAAVKPTLIARASLVSLSGDPWRPSGSLEVSVINRGKAAAKGFFVLRLPPGLDVTSGGDCRGAGSPRTWICGGTEVPAGGRREYPLTLRSTAAKPVFGVQKWGSVAGRDAAGDTESPTDFRINWPDRTSLRLRATASPVNDGSMGVTARVQNTGTFAIGGYSLNVVTPKGVQVIWPLCSDSGRMAGVGCEILRSNVLKAGATETVHIRLAVIGGGKIIRVYLAPTNRYTNKDTSVTLHVPGGGGGGAPTTPPSATPSATPTPSATSSPSASSSPTTPAGDGAELPRTGPAGTTYALFGAALLALGAGLLLLRRRLDRS
ncbi:LPXTG cell wall anchor domain-containing protein [Micromonospora peucetia]|uniref:LPXTG cell wall anchor domain-containing protein n=1 Tax=Micromonospora peucetia TaxID=47871 RepID=A0ABZ1EHR0_9ACTN|nr:LPXTG cell wall anchor domain-containing protein [Micromonospora peucetia]WSA33394.1 LPXTG cell wall anchor domain-containing protein [Micromonospora peucetia]